MTKRYESEMRVGWGAELGTIQRKGQNCTCSDIYGECLKITQMSKKNYQKTLPSDFLLKTDSFDIVDE